MMNATIPANGEAMPETDTSLATLNVLIARHAREMAADNDLWNAIPEDEEPMPRVQIGRMFKGRDDHGKDVFEEIWAYSREDVQKSLRRPQDYYLAFNGMPQERQRVLVQRLEEQHQKKLADFDRQVIQQKRRQDESGYTAAMDVARAQSDRVKTIEAEIIDFTPASLAAASRKASWVIHAIDHDGSYECEEHLMRRLAETLALAAG